MRFESITKLKCNINGLLGFADGHSENSKQTMGQGKYWNGVHGTRVKN